MIDEKENILKKITEIDQWIQKDETEDLVVDYADEYKKQTGKDLSTGEYVIQ